MVAPLGMGVLNHRRRTSRPSSLPAGSSLIWALATLTWMVWWFPAGHNRELAATWWQKILTDAYELVGVATLVVLAWNRRRCESGVLAPRA
ncbi:hypothetical protein JCM18920_210 [Cutibacterium acnes JCM 18920]|nr:hypothetical protein JCM18920_210 [Cutibacterium acnes JCM 18920]